MKWVASALVAILVLAGCGAAGTPHPSASLGTAASPAKTSEPTDTKTPRPTAPPDLRGTWEATLSTGENARLQLGPSSYTIRRSSDTGSGSILVIGDHIIFSSPLCELGKGEYAWSISNGTLTFTPQEPRDPCQNRIIWLEDTAYTRVE